MRVSDKKIILDTKKTNRIYAVGDIHGDFLTFADDLVNSCKVKNCAVIVCGDIGFGFFSAERLVQFFTEMEAQFAAKNITVIFFRGNHDDPIWFDYKKDEFCDAFPHIYIAEDFTLVDYIKGNDYSFRTLLWGGAISIDRTYRSNGFSYWKDEVVKPLPKEFDNPDLEIDCVCTHAAPSFCLPVNSNNLNSWFDRDAALEMDLKEERETLDHGAYTLYKNNRSTLSIWVYGHYHDMYFNSPRMNDEIARFEGVSFIGVDCLRADKFDLDNINSWRYDFYNRKNRNHLVELVKFR